MNINLDLNTVITIGTIAASTYAMWKINAKGFELLDNKISNVVKISEIERAGVSRELGTICDDIEGVKDQFKREIYPRLNSAEKQIEKNCRALIDHKELCAEKHKR
jgi:hypothetical protein